MKLFPEFESLIKQVQDPDQRKLFRNCLKRRVNYLAEALEHKGFIQARLEEKDGRSGSMLVPSIVTVPTGLPPPDQIT